MDKAGLMGPSPTNTPLRVREVHSEPDFLQLRVAWNRLVGRVSGDVFLRHEWFQAAWAWRRTDAVLHIVCVYDGEQLIGILPLMRTPHRASGRVLEFLCAPDTQWCDVLIDPEAGQAVGRCLVEHIVDRASQWDVLRLERLAATSQVAIWLAPALVEKGLPVRLEEAGRNIFVDLEQSWDDYKNSLSRSLKKTRNLAANRFAAVGSASLQWVRSSTLDPVQLQRCLDEVVGISAQSWKQTTGTSLDCPAPQAFLRALTDFAVKEDWLSLWFLRIDGRAVAMEYQILSEGRVYALRADFDNSLRSMSPGSYLNYCMLEQLFASGLKRYYMGPGNNPYKARWSTRSDSVHVATSFSPSLRGRANALWSQTKRKLRTIGGGGSPHVPAGKSYCDP